MGGKGSGGKGSTEKVNILQAVSSEIVEQAKQMTAARRSASPVSVEKMPAILQAWEEYIEECERTRRPITWGGLALAGGISARTLERMRHGELDHIVDEFRITHDLPPDATEYITEDGEVLQLLQWSQPCQKLEAVIQDQLERNCYTNKGNPAGSIFGLKARFGWEDQQQGPTISNQTLVIADAEQAKKAMRMLANVEK